MRPVHLALLVFQFFWLNVVVPGHQRGIVIVPDGSVNCHRPISGDQQRATGDCCRHAPAKNDSSRKEHCAVCFFAARLAIPEQPVLAPAPTDLCLRVRPLAALPAPSLGFFPTCDERAPPAV